MMIIERTYNIPLRKEWLKAPKYKRAKKAIIAVKEFLSKHMHQEDQSKIKLGEHMNLEIWEKGIKNPPHHIKVNVKKLEDETVYAELFGYELKIPGEEEKKKEKKKQEKTEVKKENKEHKKEETKEKAEEQAEKEEKKSDEEKKETEEKKPEVKGAEKEETKEKEEEGKEEKIEEKSEEKAEEKKEAKKDTVKEVEKNKN